MSALFVAALALGATVTVSGTAVAEDYSYAPEASCRPDGVFTRCDFNARTPGISVLRERHFTVPPGVSTILVEAKGAHGGDGKRASYGGQGDGNGGSYVSTYFTVTPGQSFSAYIGLAGSAGDSHHEALGGTGVGAGGFAEASPLIGEPFSGGGGGGGATRFLSEANGQGVVAGGGGGGGGADNFTGGDAKGPDKLQAPNVISGGIGRVATNYTCSSGGGGGGAPGGSEGEQADPITRFVKARCNGGYAGQSSVKDGRDSRVLLDRAGPDGYVRVSFYRSQPSAPGSGAGGVSGRADLSVDVNVPEELAVGQNGTVAVRVTNTAAVAARDVSLTMRFPSGLQVTGGPSTVAVGALAPGASVVRQYSVLKRGRAGADAVVGSARTSVQGGDPGGDTAVGLIRLRR